MGNSIKEFFGLLFRFKLRDLFITPTKNGIIQLFRTVFVGGIATIIEFIFFFAISRIFSFVPGIDYIATAIGFIISTFINFYLSRWFVFKAQEARVGFAGELAGFLIISGIGLGLKELFLWVFKQPLQMGGTVAWIIATILVLLWNFLARKYIIYKK